MNKYTKRAEEYWEETHRSYDFLFANASNTDTIAFSSNSVTWTDST